MAKKSETKRIVPLAPGDPGPGRRDAGKLSQKSAARKDTSRPTAEAEAELEDALEQTFPASDPIAMESTLVSGRRR